MCSVSRVSRHAAGGNAGQSPESAISPDPFVGRDGFCCYRPTCARSCKRSVRGGTGSRVES
jgi:hypothetical protein